LGRVTRYGRVVRQLLVAHYYILLLLWVELLLLVLDIRIAVIKFSRVLIVAVTNCVIACSCPLGVFYCLLIIGGSSTIVLVLSVALAH
jgi:hypothetical protein